MVSVRKTRLQELTVDGRRGAKALAALRDNPERFLATVQVGITVMVGDIFSEHAKKVPQLIQVEVGGTALIRGATPILELNRALGLELPEENGYTTIAGLSLALAGKLPSKGEVLSLPNGVTLEISRWSTCRPNGCDPSA